MADRRYFGNIEEVIEPPNLIEVQSKSYEDFLQKDIAPSQRTETGLQAVFKEVFPITSYDETIELDFISYDIEDPKMTALDALRTGETFSAALYVTFKLKDETGTKKERVYMGELPMMTRRGTFVINGAERVIVSQLHRSPGICFEKSIHLNGKILHSFRIIPGSRIVARGPVRHQRPPLRLPRPPAVVGASFSPRPSCVRLDTRASGSSSSSSTRSRSSSSASRWTRKS